jgi:hypothetical protein
MESPLGSPLLCMTDETFHLMPPVPIRPIRLSVSPSSDPLQLRGHNLLEPAPYRPGTTGLLLSEIY